jgi:hypothetical protein
MKIPRVKDFDPDAKVPTLKSSMDNMPSIQRPETVQRQSPSPVAPVIKKTIANSKTQLSSSTHRSFIKRTFDLFEDQLNYMKRESLQEELENKEGSMNAYVREAIDEWIKKRKLNK